VGASVIPQKKELGEKIRLLQADFSVEVVFNQNKGGSHTASPCDLNALAKS
jgi:hypothetical protein